MDHQLNLYKKFNHILKQHLRYSKKISSDDVTITKSTSVDNISLLINHDNTNYHKRDKSLDIVRNSEDNYEIVLPFQRQKNKNNDISSFIDNHDIINYEMSNSNLDF